MSIELIVATFEEDETGASTVLQRAQELDKQGALELKNGAVIVRTEDGKFKVDDVEDVDAKHGAAFGAITGGLIGLLGGPVGAIAGALLGGTTGGVSAKLIDFGVSESLIKDIERGLQPGSSALILYVELNWASKAVTLLEQAGATVSRTTMEIQDVTDLL